MRSPTSPSPLAEVIRQAGGVILGKERQIRLSLACLLARGHLLIEDLPGVGKTTLAHLLAQLLGLQFQRIQFTSDMLPADIIGVSIFERTTGGFTFHPGPIFAQLVLADEVNRATPKTQSALLEAMEERQVTTEGATRVLPSPFFVIATQNPAHSIGTFPLPESQLDRFLMRIDLGYPDHAAERELLRGADRRKMIADLPPCLTTEDLESFQEAATRIHVADSLIDYTQALVTFTRHSSDYQVGLSPRAALALLAAARAWAFLEGRDFALPEDVQIVLPAVAPHRLRPAGENMARLNAAQIASRLIEAVPLP
ncbi:MAG: AAA family ATPase [Sterolibacterium sp.]